MSIDLNLTRWINSLTERSQSADFLMILITNYGPYFLVGMIAIRWFARVDRSTNRHLAIRCGLATVLGLLMNQAILLIFQRARPYEMGITHLLILKSTDPSFPSDHATVAAAITASLFCNRASQRYLFLLVSILLCFSRIYVGTHFLGDVLGGITTGVLGASVVHFAYHWVRQIADKAVRLP